jgi:menaquinone-9 beta-reductase
MPGEVIIIGAGPAGSVAALLLARSGWSVTIIEQHRFPRDKVCGECISALGIDVLERIGMLDELLRLEPVCLLHASIHSPNGCSAKIQLPAPMWGLSRGVFDTFLLDAARAVGANIL